MERGTFPDQRLADRYRSLAPQFATRPDRSIPGALENDAQIEAAYRFIRNDRVTPDMVVDEGNPVLASRLSDDVALILHDSTAIRHSTAEDAFDTYNLGAGTFGYMAHVGFVVRETTGEPVGIGALTFVERERQPAAKRGEPTPKKAVKNGPKESLRWEEGAHAAAGRLASLGFTKTVHVMDSEGDIYELLVNLQVSGHDFVVRSSHSKRSVRAESTSAWAALEKAMENAPLHAERKVKLSRRLPEASAGNKRNPPRLTRVASLDIRAVRFEMARPERVAKSARSSVTLNLVVVKETTAPEGEKAVEWALWTTLPIETAQDVLRVVDIYRRRWLIEELFKALKTGCIFEKRRFESASTSQIALAMYLQIACDLLRMRFFEREHSKGPATDIVSPSQLAILKRRVTRAKWSKMPTISEALAAIAMLGGYLSHNGPPGWNILARGYERLLDLDEGWQMAVQSEDYEM